MIYRIVPTHQTINAAHWAVVMQPNGPRAVTMVNALILERLNESLRALGLPDAQSRADDPAKFVDVYTTQITEEQAALFKTFYGDDFIIERYRIAENFLSAVSRIVGAAQ